MRPTLHLVPAEVWANRDPAEPYVAPSLEIEGFIHCTDGAEAMVATANRRYRDDPRTFVVLTVDLDATGSPWRYDTFLPFAASDVPAGVSVERIYVVEATYSPDAERLRPAVRPEHLERIARLMADGRVIEAGGYLDLSTAVLLVRADDEEGALELFRDDVYFRAGVWTTMAARPFGRVVPEGDQREVG